MTGPGAKNKPEELRRIRQHGCWEHLVVAPLWVAYGANLGTLLRTCDAVGACMAVPHTSHYRAALDQGDTLVRRPHIHWVHRSKLHCPMTRRFEIVPQRSTCIPIRAR